MSVIGKCVAVPPEQLAAVLAAPAGVREWLELASRQAQHDCRTGHEWQALERLVGELEPPASYAVLGKRPIGTVDVRGYGAAQYLTAEEVNEAAEILAGWSIEEVRELFSLEAFRKAEVYTFDGQGETEAQAWERLRRAYESLVRFYQRAAAAEEAVVCYLH